MGETEKNRSHYEIIAPANFPEIVKVPETEVPETKVPETEVPETEVPEAGDTRELPRIEYDKETEDICNIGLTPETGKELAEKMKAIIFQTMLKASIKPLCKEFYI